MSNKLMIKKNGKNTFLKQIVNCWEFWLLCLPGIIVLILFAYWPMFGAIIAFKDFNYAKGILGSDWIGLDNFKFFFMSQDAWRITRNTLGYAVINTALSTISGVALALLMYEVSSRKLIKTYQTIYILPNFMSWVIVGYVTYVLFNREQGVFNQILVALGMEKFDWYSEPDVWPVILPLVNMWKGVGMGSIMYYATLVGMDESVFEAAARDGAGRWKQVIHISVPSLVPMITILLIMSVGSIFRSDFGLFYQITRDIGALYPTTDVVDTYVYRGLRTGDVGVTSAVGLFQSAVGLVTVVGANHIVKKLEPDNAMF